MQNKNIIITGFTGFVGRNLINYLQGNFEIAGIWRNNNPGNSSSLKSTYTYDETSTKLFSEFNTVIHLAGKAHDLKNASRPEEYHEVNVDLTQKIFDLFLQSTASTFIFMSSAKAAADDLSEALTENTIPNPQTPYGKSKLAAGQYILSKLLPENKKVYILRSSLIYGPGNKGNLNLLYQFVSKGIPYPLGAFENRRTFLSVENLCFIIEKLIEENNIPSGIYNVADDEAVSTNEIIAIMGSVLNRKIKVWKLPRNLIKLGANIGDVLHLPLNSSRLKKLTSDYLVSNQKIKNALGIKQLPVSVKDGLVSAIKSFGERGSSLRICAEEMRQRGR